MNEYKIMHIGDATDSQFGDILIVKANPIMDNGYGKSYVTHICNDTVSFFFPANNQMLINKLLEIANGGGLWTPDIDEDFIEEKIFDEDYGKRITVYRHVSFFNSSDDSISNLNSGKNVQLIPDVGYKINQFYSQFYRKGWFDMYSFSGYVQSLAEEDYNTHFWQYLFGTHQFDGYAPYELPPEYYEAYENFIDKCDQMVSSDY